MGAKSLLRKLGILGTLATAGLAIAPGAALAQPLIGLNANDDLVRFDSASPGTITSTVTCCLPAGVIGIDYRPATGQLYGISQDRLFRIDTFGNFDSASQVGPVFDSPLAGASFGFDFNPTSDRIRLVSDEDENERINPDDGSQTLDANLVYAAGDPNFGQNPNVTASAYSNNTASAASTTLYGIDTGRDVLVTQSPPNDGTLHTVGSLGVDAGSVTGFDIAPGAGSQTAFAALEVAGVTSLYSINLATGAATSLGTIGDGSTQLRGLAVQAPRNLVISEFRARGAGGSDDEFVEVYNPNDFGLDVDPPDASGGYSVVGSDGVVRSTIDASNVVPPRGHAVLTANCSSYTLNGYSGLQVCLNAVLPDNKGVALFNTSNTASFDLAHRIDAVGFTGEANALYREGAGIANVALLNRDQALVRDYATGISKDTNDNAADFLFVDVGTPTANPSRRLGAPGPENTGSPFQRNDKVAVALLDPSVSQAQPPNRVFDPTAVTNGSQGTLMIRRKLTNNTGQTITQLRVRTSLPTTTFPQPAGTADLRLLTSPDETVTVGGSPVSVLGTRLEEPPTQPKGGGINASASLDNVFSIPIAPGESRNIQLRFGVQQTGSFAVRTHIETRP